MLETYPHRLVFSQDGLGASQVTVCVSLYNYQNYIVETLQSVYQQTEATLDLVVVDDGSTDNSLSVAEHWLEGNAKRFNAVSLVQHIDNQGLSAARNTAIAVSSTPYIFILDADNLLYPRCVARCLAALNADLQASVAYPIIEKFGEEQSLISNVVWNQERFKCENCVDAMSLIRRGVLVAVGGYSKLSAVGRLGWEDYELWCKFIERGFYGLPVPEILARYRTHATSMLNSVSNKEENISKLHREMMALHSWLELPIA